VWSAGIVGAARLADRISQPFVNRWRAWSMVPARFPAIRYASASRSRHSSQLNRFFRSQLIQIVLDSRASFTAVEEGFSMRTRVFDVSVLVFLAAVGLVLAAPAQAAEGIVGTWKMNLAKSKFSPGPAPKSITTKVETAGAGIKITTDGVGPDGKPTHASYTVNFDSKDVAAMSLPNGAETIAYRKIDDTTYESISKAKGKVVATTRIVISKDGKTRTGTAVGTTIDGKPLKTFTVFERQ
jgi:hypothetical protein